MIVRLGMPGELATEESSEGISSDNSMAPSSLSIPPDFSLSIPSSISKDYNQQTARSDTTFEGLSDKNPQVTTAVETNISVLDTPSQTSKNNKTKPADSAKGVTSISQDTLIEQEIAVTTLEAPASDQTFALRNRWVAPTDSPIISRYEKEEDYGKGSAALRFGSSEGTEIVAVEAGNITFVGKVAGETYITISHGGGLRSTYSAIDKTVVAEGDEVLAGQKIAEASGELRLTARDVEGRYLDPELFL